MCITQKMQNDLSTNSYS